MSIARFWPLTLLVVAELSWPAVGQTLLPLPGLAPHSGAPTHKGPTGQPCLTFEAYAQPEFINKTIFEHWIKATNSCGQYIKVQVCYYNTDDCIMLNVPPWDKKQAVLGIYPSLRDFRYETKEQF